jgi:RNA polymerase sigma-70 factor (ECF subfamily)
MSEPSDAEFARRLGSRDRAERESAFDSLFRRHSRKSLDLAWRVLRDAGLAADAVQEAFLTVYRKGPRFEARAQFSSWLYRVVLNQSIDMRRRERRHRSASLSDPARTTDASSSAELAGDAPSMSPSPEAAALQAERARLVRVAIDRLSPKLAAVVVLRYPEGLSYEEIGEILGLPPGTVRSRLNRAHAALREILGGRLDDA